MKSLTLEFIDSSWKPFFEQNKDRLEYIDSKISKDIFNPDNRNILRFAENNILDTKVVILGQDTYPAPGIATGRAFEVGGLDSWTKPFRQVSLKNIVRNLYGTYTTKGSYTSFSNIKNEIIEGKFKILSPNLLFDSWEKQGVLLLNCALTCAVGKPGSHSNIWRDFTHDALKYFCNFNENAYFFLWGSVAKEFFDVIKDNNVSRKIYISRHPMMCSFSYSDDFLKSRCFYDTRKIINWLG